MGNIIIVVAVLLSHILRKPEAIINPSIILFPLVPHRVRIAKAIRLCKPHFSIASPKKTAHKEKNHRIRIGSRCFFYFTYTT